MVTVLFRYDDCSAYSDLSFERRLAEVFAAESACCIFGIVPMVAAGDERVPSSEEGVPLSPEKGAFLREAVARGVIEPALHGFYHRTNGVSAKLAEFAGLPAVEQRRRIAAGRVLLEEIVGRRVEVFIPPFNEYDTSTAESCAVEGMEIISAGMFGPAAEGVRLLPHTCSLKQVEKTVEGLAARQAGSDGIVMPLFHPFDFREIDAERGYLSLADLAALLERLTKLPGVRLARITDLGQADLGGARLEANGRRLRTLLHPLAAPLASFTRTAYVTAVEARRDARCVAAVSALAYAAVFFAAVFAGFAGAALAAPVALRAAGAAVAVALTLLVFFRRRPLYFRGAMVWTAATGFALGTWT